MSDSRSRACAKLSIVLLVALVLAPVSGVSAQPVNNLCANAIPVSDGATAFSTIGATTDGPVHGGCMFDGQTYNDIWFTYQASCSGELTVSTCNSAQYDTDLVVYDGCDCAQLSSSIAACNDDTSGCSTFTSTVTIPVLDGNCYLIRVGGYQATSSGTGTLNITCVDFATTPGACCYSDDACSQVLQADCLDTGGEFFGFNTPCSPNPCAQSVGPDVIYSDVTAITNWGAVGGTRAYSLGSNTCNIGTQNLPWGATTPLLAMNAYRIFDGRLEQIGMSWVKNGTTAAAGNGCGFDCNNQGGSVLGAGCLDVYGASYNGGQGILGPRSAVNAFTGQYPGQSSPQSGTIAERLQIKEVDLSSANYPGARYLVEGVYVAAADATAGNALNNASYKLVNVAASPYNMTPFGAMFETIPAIYAWQQHGLGTNVADPSVTIVPVDVPDEGRFFVGCKVTELANDQWRYDYAVYNLNSHRSASQITVPKTSNAAISNIGFHDVDYHSGEPYANTDWLMTDSAANVQWSSPQTFAQNPNTNALRWGTMYNFWFTADVPPVEGEMLIGLFRPGTPESIAVMVQVPGQPCPADCMADGMRDGRDAQPFVDCILGAGGSCDCADIDGSGAADENDVAAFIDLLMAGDSCSP